MSSFPPSSHCLGGTPGEVSGCVGVSDAHQPKGSSSTINHPSKLRFGKCHAILAHGPPHKRQGSKPPGTSTWGVRPLSLVASAALTGARSAPAVAEAPGDGAPPPSSELLCARGDAIAPGLWQRQSVGIDASALQPRGRAEEAGAF